MHKSNVKLPTFRMVSLTIQKFTEMHRVWRNRTLLCDSTIHLLKVPRSASGSAGSYGPSSRAAWTCWRAVSRSRPHSKLPAFLVRSVRTKVTHLSEVYAFSRIQVGHTKRCVSFLVVGGPRATTYPSPWKEHLCMPHTTSRTSGNFTEIQKALEFWLGFFPVLWGAYVLSKVVAT